MPEAATSKNQKRYSILARTALPTGNKDAILKHAAQEAHLSFASFDVNSGSPTRTALVAYGPRIAPMRRLRVVLYQRDENAAHRVRCQASPFPSRFV